MLSLLALSFLLHPPSSSALDFIQYSPSPNTFAQPARGWNSFSLQANPNAVGGFTLSTDSILEQCQAMRQNLGSAGFEYCSIDSGWSVGDRGDEFGRPYNDTNAIDIARIVEVLSPLGAKIGVYLLPGAFCNDKEKIIEGTSIKIGDTLSGNNNGFARCDFDFSMDASGAFIKPGVQEWHDSVIRFYAESGISFIKLDYITPGSPSPGSSANLPPDNSGSVIAFHRAIYNNLAAGSMRLHISWKLERNATYLPIWNDNADAMRTDQDINQGGADTLVAWEIVQRAIENYRQWYVAAADEIIGTGSKLQVRPDMDNLLNGNTASISGISDVKRQTIMTHWIGAGASLISGSDLTNLDDFGRNLYTNSEALAVANFMSKYPMRPVNANGETEASQLQSWIAGVDLADNCRNVIVLANYGPDEGQGGFGTGLSGKQQISRTFDQFGLGGSWNVRDIWAGEDLGPLRELRVTLVEGESRLLVLTAAEDGTVNGQYCV